MSRVPRYLATITNFMTTKSCISKILNENNIFLDIITQSDHLLSIILLSILSKQSEHHTNNDVKGRHGYFIATSIDIMMVIANIFNNKIYYDAMYDKHNIDEFLLSMSIYIFKGLTQNIKTIQPVNNDDKKTLELFYEMHEIIQNCLDMLYKHTPCVTHINKKKHDIIKYNFIDKTLIKNKFYKLNLLDKNTLISFAKEKYGCVCKCAIMCGWLLGGGDKNKIKDLEELGNTFAIMFKLAYDFLNVERDLEHSDIYSHNFIINIGIHESFCMFMETKAEVLRGCMTFDVFTSTIKEIVGMLEGYVDGCISQSDIDLQSQFSNFTNEDI